MSWFQRIFEIPKSQIKLLVVDEFQQAHISLHYHYETAIHLKAGCITFQCRL